MDTADVLVQVIAHSRADTERPAAQPIATFPGRSSFPVSEYLAACPWGCSARRGRHSTVESRAVRPQGQGEGLDLMPALLFTDIESSTSLWEEHPTALLR
jgi:hypothetical protein